jgi:hypothetical protein
MRINTLNTYGIRIVPNVPNNLGPPSSANPSPRERQNRSSLRIPRQKAKHVLQIAAPVEHIRVDTLVPRKKVGPRRHFNAPIAMRTAAYGPSRWKTAGFCYHGMGETSSFRAQWGSGRFFPAHKVQRDDAHMYARCPLSHCRADGAFCFLAIERRHVDPRWCSFQAQREWTLSKTKSPDIVGGRPDRCETAHFHVRTGVKPDISTSGQNVAGQVWNRPSPCLHRRGTCSLCSIPDDSSAFGPSSDHLRCGIFALCCSASDSSSVSSSFRILCMFSSVCFLSPCPGLGPPPPPRILWSSLCLLTRVCTGGESTEIRVWRACVLCVHVHGFFFLTFESCCKILLGSILQLDGSLNDDAPNGNIDSICSYHTLIVIDWVH